MSHCSEYVSSISFGMSHPLSVTARETIKLIKKDGHTIEGLRMSGIKNNKISYFDEDIDFEKGDTLERQLPHNKTENYIIEDVEYKPEFHNIPGYYILEIHNIGKPKPVPQVPITYNSYGANSRMNVNSTDQSRNIVNNDSKNQDLFDKIEEVLRENVNNQEELENLQQSLREMQDNQGKLSFSESYIRFIGIAADHLTVLTPFIPALTQMLMLART